MNYSFEDVVRNRYEFYYNGLTDKVCSYLSKTSDLNYKGLSTVNFKLRDLGEVEDALTILRNCNAENINSKELVDELGGLINKGTIRKLLDIPPITETLEKYLEKLGGIDIAKFTLDIALVRQELVDEIENELNITIEILDLLITATQ